MDKRKAIVEKIVRALILVIIGIGIGIVVTSSNYKERMQERQEYAQNAYNLGKAEWLAILNMPPEEAAKLQEKIEEVINSELSLKEQEEVMDEIFQIIEKYIAGEEEPSEPIGL